MSVGRIGQEEARGAMGEEKWKIKVLTIRRFFRFFFFFFFVCDGQDGHSAFFVGEEEE
jgi:hypothetical protein